MKIASTSEAFTLVELSSAELDILNNALNEVCNGVDLGTEFQTRIGYPEEEARRLLAEVAQIRASRERAS